MRHLKHILLALALVLLPITAQAHFLTGAESREIHVMEDPDDGETMVLLRFPLSFVFAAELPSRRSASDVVNAPFLQVEHVSDVPFYRIDQKAYEDDYNGFVDYVLKDYRFTVDGQEIKPELGILSLVPTKDAVGPAKGVKGSQEMLQICTAFPGQEYIADIEVAVQIYLLGVKATETVTIEVRTPKVSLPPTMVFDTHITDHRVSPSQTVTHEGFYPPAITLSGTRSDNILHWIWQGAVHILGGLDHLLFVTCLALAATGLRGLLWSVTGFTLGHSVTLSAGVLGWVPTVNWFIPAVELGVAVSIVAMAVLVLVRHSGQMGFGVAAALGLLHGFGFAFMLTPLIGEASVVLPLAGFNIGVELGQIANVAVVFGLIHLFDQQQPRLGKGVRVAVAMIAVAIALTMMHERVDLVSAELPSAAQISGGV